MQAIPVKGFHVEWRVGNDFTGFECPCGGLIRHVVAGYGEAHHISDGQCDKCSTLFGWSVSTDPTKRNVYEETNHENKEESRAEQVFTQEGGPAHCD
jgi:hypothetical protein